MSRGVKTRSPATAAARGDGIRQNEDRDQSRRRRPYLVVRVIAESSASLVGGFWSGPLWEQVVVAWAGLQPRRPHCGLSRYHRAIQLLPLTGALPVHQ